MSDVVIPGLVQPPLPNHLQLPCKDSFPLDNSPVRSVLPNHLQLPSKDDIPVENSQEHPQSELLSAPIEPVLQKLFPGGRCFVGCDVGIYFHYTDPPSKGCRAPDWFLVPEVPLLLGGQLRRSYVMWQEVEPPLVVIEYASGDGAVELDQTPQTGKFWIYERAIHAAYYAVFVWDTGTLQVHHLDNNRYRRMEPNDRGHYPLAPLGLELGVWKGTYNNITVPWLRWYDRNGGLLPPPQEEAQQLSDEKRLIAAKYERLVERLKSLGVNPDNDDVSEKR